MYATLELKEKIATNKIKLSPVNFGWGREGMLDDTKPTMKEAQRKSLMNCHNGFDREAMSKHYDLIKIELLEVPQFVITQTYQEDTGIFIYFITEVSTGKTVFRYNNELWEEKIFFIPTKFNDIEKLINYMDKDYQQAVKLNS